jgi:uncharacterized membrane protein
MSDLVVIAFSTEAKAEEVRQKLLAMQKEYLIELDDAVVAAKGAQGRIKLNQLINTTTAGAVSGTFWGTLIGLIFLMPLVGAAMGAASGALGGASTDLGINDKRMKETAAAIQPLPFSRRLRRYWCSCARSRRTRFLSDLRAKAAQS